MSGSLNKVILVGNLGKDPEIRQTTAGKKVASFSLATNESWKDRETGERRQRTEWHRVVVFNERLADVVEQYVKGGQKVLVEGQLATRKWQGQDGQDRYTTEVVLQPYNGNLEMLSGRGNGPPPAEDGDAYGTTRTTDPGPDQRRDYSADLDDEIPF
jgi:single-strand DNA-binding protein